MNKLYPLTFQPIFRRYIWGGRRLESLGKQLGPGDDYAESWEIVDRRDDQSVVATGPLAGWTLHRLVGEQGEALLGRHAGAPRFPLLMKFLDAHDRLSVQVHPDDARAAVASPPDVGKTEAWVILAADPGSHLYAGLTGDADRDTLRRELSTSACSRHVARIEPAVGDCFLLPAGVVHALGPGLLVAEIQQSSDTTYRLYDWDRPGPDGRPRPLHVEAALQVIDFDSGPVAAQRPQATDRPNVERLVACDKFVLDRWKVRAADERVAIGGDNRCHIVTVVEGAIDIAGDPAGTQSKGSVILLPAALGGVGVSTASDAVLLDAYLP
jgi:mannose-6-phosphate isomerase